MEEKKKREFVGIMYNMENGAEVLKQQQSSKRAIQMQMFEAVAVLDRSQKSVMTAIYQRITGAFASVLSYLFYPVCTQTHIQINVARMTHTCDKKNSA